MLTEFDDSERLVLAALTGDVSTATTLLDEELDYKRLTQFALRHEIVGELSQFVVRHGIELEPSLNDALNAFVERLADQATRAEQETARLAKILDENAIPSIFAKGVVAGALYRKPGTVRTVKDVDVYVAPSMLEVALDTLCPHYNTLGRDGGPSLRRDISRLHHVSLWSQENQVMVELHFAAAAPWHGLCLDVARTIERAVPFNIAARAIMTLSPIDAVVFWSVELAKDSWASLKKILDFSRSVEHAASEDECLVEAFLAARECGAERILRISLILSASLGTLAWASIAVQRATADKQAVAIARICFVRLARGTARPPFHRRVQEGLRFAQKHDALAAQIGHVVRIIILYRVRNWLRRGNPF